MPPVEELGCGGVGLPLTYVSSTLYLLFTWLLLAPIGKRLWEEGKGSEVRAGVVCNPRPMPSAVVCSSGGCCVTPTSFPEASLARICSLWLTDSCWSLLRFCAQQYEANDEYEWCYCYYFYESTFKTFLLWFTLLSTSAREVVFKGEITPPNFTGRWKFRGHFRYLFVDGTLFCRDEST